MRNKFKKDYRKEKYSKDNSISLVDILDLLIKCSDLLDDCESTSIKKDKPHYENIDEHKGEEILNDLLAEEDTDTKWLNDVTKGHDIVDVTLPEVHECKCNECHCKKDNRRNSTHIIDVYAEKKRILDYIYEDIDQYSSEGVLEYNLIRDFGLEKVSYVSLNLLLDILAEELQNEGYDVEEDIFETQDGKRKFILTVEWDVE